MKKFLIILGVIIGVIALMLLLNYPIMLLWNWLMPMIFGLTKLTFWQMFGLQALSGVLFKSYNFTKST